MDVGRQTDGTDQQAEKSGQYDKFARHSSVKSSPEDGRMQEVLPILFGEADGPEEFIPLAAGQSQSLLPSRRGDERSRFPLPVGRSGGDIRFVPSPPAPAQPSDREDQ